MKRNLLLLFALIMIGLSANAQVSLIGAGATDAGIQDAM
jgi:accessory colonization factor AcfC